MKEFFNKMFENKISFWTIFGFIILLGLGLRLTLINFPLWYDEGCSLAISTQVFPKGIMSYLWNVDLQHTPLYFYILHFIMKYLGDSVVIMRLTSLVVSLAILPITYIVTEKLSSKKVALLAMLFMAVNTFQVLYSIEIRMYPYVILLSLLSINYLIDYDKKSDKASLIKMGIVNILNPYFLTGSIVFVLAEFILYSCYLDYTKADETKIGNYVKSNLITFLFFIPYVVIIGHYALVRHTFLVTDLSKFTSNNFWGMLQNLVACDPGHIHETRFEGFNFDLKTVSLIFLPIIVMLSGLIYSLKDKERLNRLIFGIITLCFVIFVFLANSKTVAFTGRYLIFITPFIFILGAIGISKFNKYLAVILTILYAAGCCTGLWLTYPQYKNIAEFSLKSPADFVKKNYPQKDNLVIMPFASSVSFYYFKGENVPKVMPLELFYEVRNPDSSVIYDDKQKEAFKKYDKYAVFQSIILKDEPISKNLIDYLNSYISKVPKGGYIIWVVYYSDNYAIRKPQDVKIAYSNILNVQNHTMSGMLSKFDLDLIGLLLSQANFVRRDRDASNSFFVFQKR